MQFKVLMASTMAMMSVAANAQVLSWQGVGPVQLGMSVAEAERALNAKLGLVSLPYSNECYVTKRADGKDEALSYVVVDSKIVVMTVWLPGDRQPSPNIVDENGIGVGSTESDIRRGYKLVEKVLAPYFRETEEELAAAARERARQGITTPEPSRQYWIIAESPDHERAIIFQTEDEKVLYMRTGFKPDVMSFEDCI
jgi:hypothetical protein